VRFRTAGLEDIDHFALFMRAPRWRRRAEATGVINNDRALSTTQKNQLITFLQSL
jgi:hypothetical protein